MLLAPMDIDRATAILNRAGEVGAAQILAAQAGIGNRVRVIQLDLSTARLITDPYIFGEPFQSMTVMDASDSAAQISCRLDSQDSDNKEFTVKAPATIEVPPLIISKAYFHWTAQASKTITLAFLKFGSFKTNQTNLSLSGGVNTTDGSSSALSQISLVTVVATQIAASSTARKKIEFRNETGGPIYVGPDSTVTDSSTTKGRIVDNGDDYSWYNTGPLYAYNPGATATLTILTHS